MALDANQLTQAILQAFQSVANDPSVADSQKKLSSGLANAIHQYVSAASVRGIQIDLTKGTPAPQVADGKLS